MSVAIVTVNWNRWKLTQACVAAVRQSICRDFHIYIVDNASTDGSRDKLSDLGPDVTLIEHPTNSGWSGGNNVGVARALSDGHEFVFLLNNDAVLDPVALDVLLKAHVSVTAGGSKLAPVLGAIERQSSGQAGFVRAAIDPATGIPGWSAGLDPAKEPALIPTAYVHGAALFAHRSVFERTGMFDERFFLVFDETDWCFRARQAGHPIFTVRDAAILHDGSATIGGIGSPLNIYFYNRNRLLFAEKHCTDEQRRAVERLQQADSRTYMQTGPARANAFRHGVQDYANRRFGDCPDVIRQLNRSTARKLAALRQQQNAPAVPKRGPKISCLMVTRGDLFPARFAIGCYRRQTYPNRELVVVCDRPANDVERWIAKLNDPSIRYVQAKPAVLGTLRNVSMSHAVGELVCQWDDDDLYHPRRLEFQQRQLAKSGGAAHFLSHWLMWWPARRLLALSSRRAWEGSMLARKDAVPHYPAVRLQEDTAIVEQLVQSQHITYSRAPNLYCYIVHGSNAWQTGHFDHLFDVATHVVPPELYEKEIARLSRSLPIQAYQSALVERNLYTISEPALLP